MAAHFFPSPARTDLQDLEAPTHVKELESILQFIEVIEVEEVTNKPPSNKAPGSDGIPNHLLKNSRKSLSKVLAEVFSACISLEYHPKGFEESITVVLKKPQKPRYDTPKAYRPIALLNTMGKVLEKLVANRISKAAEDHNFLPAEKWGPDLIGPQSQLQSS